ncbi:heat shock protein transcriptional repressor HspR [Citricoccus sp. NR2]|uniref:heat shock protein transcriptional repressor HspR n=1 Tax=Citricoccus sp. NR2 TaxID=3004095 RepID=UPI0022DD9E9A|nr:helix-turn-helix transcriptional regulator [Citricoccus sp. NR2]WBL20401.1 helix-turn-helix transcriptional regulator [Citricoccus sp. NR2]
MVAFESRGFSDASTPIFVISVAAELADMHPQTLRQYDRLGLVVPQRQGGGQRRYSRADLHRLRRIQVLSREGVSLEGIRRIVELEGEVDQLRQTVAHLMDQVNLLHDQGRFSRTFTAGTTGDVTTRFTTPGEGSAGRAGTTGSAAERERERAAAEAVRRRGRPALALEPGAGVPKVRTWRRTG